MCFDATGKLVSLSKMRVSTLIVLTVLCAVTSQADGWKKPPPPPPKPSCPVFIHCPDTKCCKIGEIVQRKVGLKPWICYFKSDTKTCTLFWAWHCCTGVYYKTSCISITENHTSWDLQGVWPVRPSLLVWVQKNKRKIQKQEEGLFCTVYADTNHTSAQATNPSPTST